MTMQDESTENTSCSECGEEVIYARGLCRPCYDRARSENQLLVIQKHSPRPSKATCHPDRPAERSDGLCKQCYKRRYKYGIVDVMALLNEQNWRCASCGDEIDEDTADVDHDHVTSRVRGLLCRTCNTLIGWIEHSKLPHALAYLNRVSNEETTNDIAGDFYRRYAATDSSKHTA